MVSSVSGTVLVKPTGTASYSRLRGRRTIPVGSTVNATRGKVRLVGAVDRRGGTQAGVFYGGAFRAGQARRNRAVIDLELVGGSFAGCGSASTSAAARRRIRRLWGIAKGRFRTRGRHSAATVRGTKWLTEDKCHSTLIASRQGEVTVDDGVAERSVDDFRVEESFCTKDPRFFPHLKKLRNVRLSIPGWAGLYCAHVKYSLPDGRCRPIPDSEFIECPSPRVLFRLVLELREAERPRTADVCVRREGGGEERCTTYNFSTCDASECLYFAGDSCAPDSGPGDYVFRWRVNGVDLPFPLTASAPPPVPEEVEDYHDPPCLNVQHRNPPSTIP